MQKILKTKINYKKIPNQKEYQQKYQFKHSQTLSTNESKIHQSSQKSSLIFMNSLNLNSLIQKNLRKYGTSNDQFYLDNFQDTFGRARTRQKILLKDCCHYKEQQNLQNYCNCSDSAKQFQQLFEYYKYYINNPILFPKEHFKILYNFYQKKKYLQYKKLKAILDLDDDRDSQTQNSMNQNITVDAKKETKQTTKTFYIMNLIHTDDKNNQSQSKAFLELNSNLEKILQKEQKNISSTPQHKHFLQVFQKTQANFKKKKINSPYLASNKNTVQKKSKKQSFNNSNSSFKKPKHTKTSKQSLNPFKFISQIVQSPHNFKPKTQQQLRKKRHNSNLSMGDLQGKTHHANLFSPKKNHKKRLNSCQTVIDRFGSRQKALNQKKKKKMTKIDSKIKFEKTQQVEVSEFQEYLKKMSYNSNKNTISSKNVNEGLSSHTPKYKRQNSQQKRDSQIRIKRIKKKRISNLSSGKNSLQRSPNHNSKQHLIEENIVNLKKKIRLQKQTFKSSNSNSNLLVQSYKKQKANLNVHPNK